MEAKRKYKLTELRLEKHLDVTALGSILRYRIFHKTYRLLDTHEQREVENWLRDNLDTSSVPTSHSVSSLSELIARGFEALRKS
jgi:hypothetical protein